MTASKKAREKLNLKNAKKLMDLARAENTPRTPPTLQQLIDDFESQSVPDKFQKNYLGHVSVKIKGLKNKSIVMKS